MDPRKSVAIERMKSFFIDKLLQIYSEGGPRKSFLPSGSVTSRPAIRSVSSLERQPVTEIVSPTFSAPFVHPVRRRVLGGCPSKAQFTVWPDSSLTST